jgi:two-component system invasion response regulator UvrY
MIRVQLIAGQRLVHIALKALIERAPGIDLVAQAFTAEEGLEQLDPSRSTIAMVALSLEDADGVETIRRLQRLRPQLAIVGFGEPSGGPFPHHMLDAGATAYVSLQAEEQEWIAALRRAQVGQRFLSADVARNLAFHSLEGGDHRNPFALLSGRELQVAHLVIRCRRVSVIARALSLSPKTVNSYRYRIFEKLAIDSDVQLTLLALEHGLVSRRSLKTESEAEAEAIVGD